MDMISLIKSCDTAEDVEMLESCFQLTSEEKDQAFYHKSVIMYRFLGEELKNDVVNPDLFLDWSSEDRAAFRKDRADDSFVDHLALEPPPQLAEPEASHQIELPYQNQLGGKRKRVLDGESSKRQKTIDYFTIRPGKQVNIRKFRTIGMIHNSTV